jgi:peptidoglycan/xylan/chitin deacetylase (PgdA/CDA1 family)
VSGAIKRGVFVLLRLSLLPRLLRARFQRERVTAILYHAIEPERLDHHLAALTRRYHFIPLAEYVEARQNGGTARLPRNAAVLTFDDGHAVNAAVLPVLRKYGIRPTIFVCTGIVGSRRHFWFRDAASRGEIPSLKALPDAERLALLGKRGFEEEREYPDRQALTWEEMEAMREWVDFQPHTRFHPILPRCDAERARREIVASKADLEARGYAVTCFAYPDGAYTAREEAMVREAGYASAMTVDLGYNNGTTDLYRLKRISLNDAGDVSEVLVKASGLWGWIRLRLKGHA